MYILEYLFDWGTTLYFNVPQSLTTSISIKLREKGLISYLMKSILFLTTFLRICELYIRLDAEEMDEDLSENVGMEV